MIIPQYQSNNTEIPGSVSGFAQHPEILEQLLAIGTALSSRQDLGELLNLIVTKSREITCSDAGSVYLIDHSDAIPKLLFKIAQNDSRPSASFREFAMPITPNSLAGYAALTGESLNLPDAYNLSQSVSYQIDRSFDSDFDYRTCSVLVLPMQNQNGEIIAVLQLINRKIKPDAVLTPETALELTQPYSELEENIVRSLASLAAISIERNHLEQSVEKLFDNFIKASVQIIEVRDPVTFGHSERVAELTVRISEEASAVTRGSLRSIYFSDSQLQEIRYAALLHDFGKICVPEAILMKQKKLYAEQLEIIRHRFALTQRTLELECAQNKFKDALEYPQNQQLEEFDTQLTIAIKKINRYWELIIKLNEPEPLPNQDFNVFTEDVLNELKELSEYVYRDINGELKPLLTSTEMSQLKLPRGNLSTLERLKIEAHVTHTYEFLKRIPWTNKLKNVPLIASLHHERLDGSGYPQGLKQQDIPIQTQILTIADIYDALTASDRPYKRRLDLETSLTILREAAMNNKINSDLVELFEQRQVFSVLGHT